MLRPTRNARRRSNADRLRRRRAARAPRRSARGRCRSGTGASCRSARRSVPSGANTQHALCTRSGSPSMRDRQRAADQPDRRARAPVGEEALDRAVARRFGDRELVGVAPRHQAEVLGQRDQLRRRRAPPRRPGARRRRGCAPRPASRPSAARRSSSAFRSRSWRSVRCGGGRCVVGRQRRVDAALDALDLRVGPAAR